MSLAMISKRESTMTVSLPTDLTSEIREMVQEGIASSADEVIRNALTTYVFLQRNQKQAIAQGLQDLEDILLEQSLAEAATDPVFLQEQEEFIEDFEEAIGEVFSQDGESTDW